jgi:2-polyprenyl-6-hydroxyphenyl methylase/3-demethylubiquinone-9 3-methyltransferase
VVSEACRLLRPGGTLVVDTVNATALARFLVVTLAERVTRLAPRGLHDPGLFVRPELVRTVGQRHGVALAVRGVRPAVGDLLRWLVDRRRDVRLVPTFTTGVLYQAWGVKEG